MNAAQNKNITIKFFVILIASIVLFSSGFDKPRQQKPASRGFLHVEGKRVVDEKGNEIFLRGFAIDPFRYSSFKEFPYKYSLEEINHFNSELFKRYITEDDIKDMKSMGANVVRKQISFYALEIEPYKYNDGVLKDIDDLIERSYKHGVYVIISLTAAAQNSKQKDNIKHYGGKMHLWTNKDWRKRVVAAWAFIAEHFVDNPGITGYDVINEPEAPSKQALHSFHTEVIRAIRTIDKKHIIILENQHFSNYDTIIFGGKYNDSNIMLSPHMYEDAGKKIDKQSPNIRYSTREQLSHKITASLAVEEVKDRPVFVGEFSTLTSAGEEGLHWTKDIIDIMNEQDMHYTYFSYKNIFGTWENRGLYQYKRGPIFGTNKNIPPEKIMASVLKNANNLLTSNFETFPKLRRIIEEGFRE